MDKAPNYTPRDAPQGDDKPKYTTHETPVLQEHEIMAIGERYGIAVDPDNVTQYRLCQVIYMLQRGTKAVS